MQQPQPSLLSRLIHKLANLATRLDQATPNRNDFSSAKQAQDTYKTSSHKTSSQGKQLLAVDATSLYHKALVEKVQEQGQEVNLTVRLLKATEFCTACAQGRGCGAIYLSELTSTKKEVTQLTLTKAQYQALLSGIANGQLPLAQACKSDLVQVDPAVDPATTQALNSGLVPGDVVQIYASQGLFLSAAVLLYLVPMVILLSMILVLSKYGLSNLLVVAIALGLVAVWFIGVRFFSRKVNLGTISVVGVEYLVPRKEPKEL